MYADGTVLFAHDENVVAARLSAAMNRALHWLNKSCLILNMVKTVTMYFSNKKIKRFLPNIRVNSLTIQNVDELKYLFTYVFGTYF